jgi:hypothetical protein
MPEDPTDIGVESLYGARTDAPLVKLIVGTHEVIIPPEKARLVGGWLIQAAEAAYGDAFLVGCRASKPSRCCASFAPSASSSAAPASSRKRSTRPPGAIARTMPRVGRKVAAAADPRTARWPRLPT